MKRISLFLLTIGIGITLMSYEPIPYSDFCDGWSDGYCEGYKSVEGQYATCPTAPACPTATIGKSTFKGGYNLGYEKGKKDAKE